MKESDLYPPLKKYLEAQNYEVKGEVQDCDVAAIRGDEIPVIVELKLVLNLQVILQAVDRLALSPIVYVAVPEKCKSLKRHRKQMIKLLKMLGIGLITIAPERLAGNVATVLDPGEYKPRISKHRQQRLLREFSERVGDPNPGGMDKRKGRMTAYRQRALAIADFLKHHGPAKASQVASALQDPKSRELMYNNVYGWFENPSRGVYNLSPKGKAEIQHWEVGATEAR
ncbi:DUF2161 family putative PD-(D/E)XK-type phosphodiesterase [Kiritimatiellaeota bacterium B1221]|nr:DUF2161 family putative PD-(D/E)XK-type phosphodiesterase [Kiritimatiellaeota bacterium B1221]